MSTPKLWTREGDTANCAGIFDDERHLLASVWSWSGVSGKQRAEEWTAKLNAHEALVAALVAANNDYDDTGCDDCGVISATTIKKIRAALVMSARVALLPPARAESALETIERIAKDFCDSLLELIGEEKMREVAALNRGESNPCNCHTHDFVDANEVMSEAFTGVTGREILDAVQAQYAAGTPYEHDDRIWSASWAKAREMIQTRFPEQKGGA